MNKENVQNFYKNYNDIINAIDEEYEKNNDEKLLIYKSAITTLPESMISYVKSMFNTITCSKEEYFYQNDYIDSVMKNNNSRIIEHNGLIVSIKIADKVCRIFNKNELYGKLGEFKENIEPLLQNNIYDKSYLTKEALDMRNDISSWAVDVLLKALGHGKEYEYSDYMKNSDSFLIVNSFFKHLSDQEILNEVKEKISRNY